MGGSTTAIRTIQGKIEDKLTEKRERDAQIIKLEAQTTSVKPTVDEINAVLRDFGFRNFSLSMTDDETCYKLVREDGSDAKNTLSEGEQSFITFLYFYNLIKGSESESGITDDRIVVFDDPVSSLDSDVLFIVSSLIKSLFEDVDKEIGNIKQIFILTHNVYFHKSVSFNPKRPKDGKLKDETFWIVRKNGLQSQIQSYNYNPIKASYELLWDELRESKSCLTIQNCMRRILEHYFRILGNTDYDELCGNLEGDSQVICNSLFSWANYGSHTIDDDLCISADAATIDKYLKVFEDIFDKNGQSSHFRMMMGKGPATNEEDSEREI